MGKKQKKKGANPSPDGKAPTEDHDDVSAPAERAETTTSEQPAAVRDEEVAEHVPEVSEGVLATAAEESSTLSTHTQDPPRKASSVTSDGDPTSPCSTKPRADSFLSEFEPGTLPFDYERMLVKVADREVRKVTKRIQADMDQAHKALTAQIREQNRRIQSQLMVMAKEAEQQEQTSLRWADAQFQATGAKLEKHLEDTRERLRGEARMLASVHANKGQGGDEELRASIKTLQMRAEEHVTFAPSVDVATPNGISVPTTPTESISTPTSHIPSDAHVIPAAESASVFEYYKDIVVDREPITSVAFAHGSSCQLALGSMTGVVYVVTVDDEGTRIDKTLLGHSQGVTDVTWSSGNEYIMSTSLDKTIRLWDWRNEMCLRNIAEESECLCVRTMPRNNNLFVVGTAGSKIRVYNSSTGMCAQTISVAQSNQPGGGGVRTIAMTDNGDKMFVGDELGTVHVFAISKDRFVWACAPIKVSAGVPVTSISYTYGYGTAEFPSILVNSCDNSLRVFSVAPNGQLTLKKRFPIIQQALNLRSAFCPVITPPESGKSSEADALFLVSASEDMVVYLFDLTRGSASKNAGHNFKCIAVASNATSDIVASSDAGGRVIFWKR